MPRLYSPNLDQLFPATCLAAKRGQYPRPETAARTYHVSLTRESDKKLLAEDDEGQLNLTNQWQMYTLSFRRPKTEQTKEYSEVN
jgi:hypothetical protein